MKNITKIILLAILLQATYAQYSFLAQIPEENSLQSKMLMKTLNIFNQNKAQKEQNANITNITNSEKTQNITAKPKVQTLTFKATQTYPFLFHMAQDSHPPNAFYSDADVFLSNWCDVYSGINTIYDIQIPDNYEMIDESIELCFDFHSGIENGNQLNDTIDETMFVTDYLKNRNFIPQKPLMPRVSISKLFDESNTGFNATFELKKSLKEQIKNQKCIKSPSFREFFKKNLTETKFLSLSIIFQSSEKCIKNKEEATVLIFCGSADNQNNLCEKTPPKLTFDVKAKKVKKALVNDSKVQTGTLNKPVLKTTDEKTPEINKKNATETITTVKQTNKDVNDTINKKNVTETITTVKQTNKDVNDTIRFGPNVTTKTETQPTKPTIISVKETKTDTNVSKNNDTLTTKKNQTNPQTIEINETSSKTKVVSIETKNLTKNTKSDSNGTSYRANKSKKQPSFKYIIWGGIIAGVIFIIILIAILLQRKHSEQEDLEESQYSLA